MESIPNDPNIANAEQISLRTAEVIFTLQYKPALADLVKSIINRSEESPHPEPAAKAFINTWLDLYFQVSSNIDGEYVNEANAISKFMLDDKDFDDWNTYKELIEAGQNFDKIVTACGLGRYTIEKAVP